jgi:hypothetical protein
MLAFLWQKYSSFPSSAQIISLSLAILGFYSTIQLPHIAAPVIRAIAIDIWHI